jgi:segregation and condensation protein B
MSPEQSIIVYLFAKAEPVKHAELFSALSLDAASGQHVLARAAAALDAVGLALVDDGKEVELRTASTAAALVERIRKEEFSRDIGRAGLETLAIVLYRGPVSRSQIDYVRGVNSSHILRALSMRGLIRRVANPKDERAFLYEPTTELLAHLGVASLSGLPEYAEMRQTIDALEKGEPSAEASAPDTTRKDDIEAEHGHDGNA